MKLRVALFCLFVLLAGHFAAAQDEPSVAETPKEATANEPAANAKLPWEKGAAKRGPTHLQGFRNAREMLKFLGIESSEFESFFHGEPLTPSEEDVLFKLLHVMPRLGLEDLHRWRKNEIDWTAVSANPNDFRGEIIRLKGRAKSLKKMPLLPEVVDRFEYDHYYRVEVELADAPLTALLCSRTVPASWKPDEPLDEPISVDAMFLKLGEDVGDSPQAVFAAQRLSWYPEQKNKTLKVGETEVRLAKLGFDVGLLSELRETNYQGIGPLDREPFYGLLEALGQVKPGVLQGPPLDEAGLANLLQDPRTAQGQPLRVSGSARRIMKLKVEDADVRQRFGIEHYYEIDFFIPLQRPVKFRRGPKDTDPPTYTNFPATICVVNLPPGVPEGDNLRQSFEAEGVFFKIWTYQADIARQHHQANQAAPMFLASTILPVDNNTKPVLTHTDFAVAGGLLFSLILFGGLVWLASRRHKPGSGADLITGIGPVKIVVPEEKQL